MRRTELFVLLVILVIASFFRLSGLHTTPPGLYPDEAMVGNEALNAWNTGHFAVFYPFNNGEEGLYADVASVPIHFLGNTAYALRLTSAIAGILTVLGVYFLARILFDSWEIAALSAFLMATGFWHVNFSRIGFRAILAPLIASWSFYFLIKGIRSHRLWHWGLSGFFLGLGMYTYIAFRAMPAVTICVVLAYWLTARASFSHDRYTYTRGQFWGNAALLVGVSLLVAAPLAAYFGSHPEDFIGRASQVSVFSNPHPLAETVRNAGKELGMFFFTGDFNWRHNLSGQPVLFWPVAALFAIGLLHTFWRLLHTWYRRKHPGLPQVLLLSWFVLGLAPAFVSDEGIPHALRSIMVAPVVYIMAAVGLHWLYGWLRRWYAQRDEHHLSLPWRRHAGEHGHRMQVSEGGIVVGIAVIGLLAAIGIGDAHRYFIEWGQNPIVQDYFNADSAELAAQINALPLATLKYVVVDAGGVLVNGIPMPAQTVMYLTDTWTPEGQAAKHVAYLSPSQLRTLRIPRNAQVFHITQ